MTRKINIPGIAKPRAAAPVVVQAPAPERHVTGDGSVQRPYQFAPPEITYEEVLWATQNSYMDRDIREQWCVVIREYAYREHHRLVGQRFNYTPTIYFDPSTTGP